MPKRRALSEIRRTAYLTSRTIGDVQAVQRGTLARRLVRRQVTRSLFRLFR